MMQYLKYLLEGLAVAAAAYFIPKRKTSVQEVAMIALTAAATFAVLDLFAPAVGSGARHGAGFGIGARHVGFGEGFVAKGGDDEHEARKVAGKRRRDGDTFRNHKEMEEGFEHHDKEHYDHHDKEEFEEHEEEDFNVEGFSGF